jgi:transcriptional regulator with XRE-family HTH domain
MSAIGARIRQRRIELGLTQQELAECMSSTQDAISKLENIGPRSIATLERIATALDATPHWLGWGVYPKVAG